MVAGSGHHKKIGLEILMEDEFAAFGTLDPKVFGRLPAKKRSDLGRDDVDDPVHGRSIRNVVFKDGTQNSGRPRDELRNRDLFQTVTAQTAPWTIAANHLL
jgi:hypothetical protein